MTPAELRARNFLSVREAAEFFADDQPCDERTVRRAIEQGQIPAVKVGTKTLIPVAPLLAMVQAPPPAPAEAPATVPTADAVTAAREILHGALRALDALTGYHGQDHGPLAEGGTAGQAADAGGPDVPRLPFGGARAS
ncbi:helix-turn-helix domain-containing protein [Actinomadura rugatobispora]|uniref:Helix-turn-helix domain-containing protein n=1 Tax=Actinomadura rugatobispora TaxID=1994 RepID=A0ABW1A1S4_9ACTN|nr:hypothetical protein GCM10010200_029120 [Actinomadura rugatobispora]